MWMKFPLHVRGVKKKVIELMSVAHDVSFLLHYWNEMWYICKGENFVLMSIRVLHNFLIIRNGSSYLDM